MPKKKKIPVHTSKQEAHLKDFFDMISPSTMQFNTDHFICGDTYRCVWAVREYPPSTEEQAVLARIADRNGVTVRIYHRLVEVMEQKKIIQKLKRAFCVMLLLAMCYGKWKTDLFKKLLSG